MWNIDKYCWSYYSFYSLSVKAQNLGLEKHLKHIPFGKGSMSDLAYIETLDSLCMVCTLFARYPLSQEASQSITTD